jgi:hypothetical protein
MKKDEKAMELRNIYMEMDENQKEKMELLAVNLLNAQKSLEGKPSEAMRNDRKK